MNLGLGLLSKGRNNCDSAVNCQNDIDNGSSTVVSVFILFILLHEKFLQSDWLRAGVFLLNLKYLHVKITNLLRVVV